MIDRVTQMGYGVTYLRAFLENDVRFLAQA